MKIFDVCTKMPFGCTSKDKDKDQDDDADKDEDKDKESVRFSSIRTVSWMAS